METGAKLGPYEILEPLGKGGMGEVYLAQDTRLGRKVAIKVLPPEFAVDPERVARFEQEARAAAALNHPHIAAVYDIGEHDAGVRYIVQEYLQGHSLRHLLQDGALPLKRALRLGTEITEALDAAHAAGIIHRDIKPDNVFVTPDGHAKVLDFGLAKLTEISPASNSDASMSPTLLGTIAGQVMGTAGYMSPEQVEGSSSIDHRADLFAFGSLLYEMVSGSRAFAGRSVADTLSRIQHDDPVALVDRDSALPAELQRIETKLLAKDPAERYQHAADLIVDLRNLSRAVEAGTATPMSATGSFPTGAAGASRPRPDAVSGAGLAAGESAAGGARSVSPGLALIGALALAALGVWIGSRLPAEPAVGSGREVQFSLDLPDEVVELPRGQGSIVVISPDGQTIGFIGLTTDGHRRMYRRRLDAVGSERLGDAHGATAPSFSRDSAWVSIGDLTSYTRAKVDGGEQFPLCESCQDGTWADDGDFYFAYNGALWRQTPGGSDRELMLEPLPGQGVGYMTRPMIFPGSRAALVEVGSFERGGVAAISFDDRRVVHIAADGSDPFYSRTGHVLFPRENSLFAVPFDPEALTIGGPAEPVLSGVRVENAGAVQADLADNGTLVYAPAVGTSGTSLVLVGRDGGEQKVIGERRNYSTPRVSPDGTRAAVVVNDNGRTEVWIVDLRTDVQVRITTVGSATSPAWSPDGSWLAFSARKGDGFAMFAVDIDSQDVRELHQSEYQILPMAVTRDGSELLFIEMSPRNDVFALRLGDRSAAPRIRPILETAAAEEAATLSFDGRLLVYESDRNVRREIFVREVATGREIQVSTRGGAEPAWSRASHEVFFRDTVTLMMVAVTIGVDPDLEVSARETLFSVAPYWMGLAEVGYDTAPGGEFLLVRHRDPGAPPDSLHVILNFADRLTRRE